MKKVQLYADPIKDEVVFNLIDKLEEESQNTRGYVQNQIKERLKAFELLVREVGSDDPMQVVLACMKGVSNIEKPDAPVEKKEINPKMKKLVDAVDSNFGIDL